MVEEIGDTLLAYAREHGGVLPSAIVYCGMRQVAEDVAQKLQVRWRGGGVVFGRCAPRRDPSLAPAGSCEYAARRTSPAVHSISSLFPGSPLPADEAEPQPGAGGGAHRAAGHVLSCGYGAGGKGRRPGGLVLRGGAHHDRHNRLWHGCAAAAAVCCSGVLEGMRESAQVEDLILHMGGMDLEGWRFRPAP